jgi:hypothetical protein
MKARARHWHVLCKSKKAAHPKGCAARVSGKVTVTPGMIIIIWLRGPQAAKQ